MPQRKTDPLHQRDHLDGDPLAEKQAPPFEEWTEAQWKLIGGLVAMGAHFSKQSPGCLKRPTGRDTLRPPKNTRPQKLRSLDLLWAREVARNYDPIKRGDRATRSSYKALRARLKVPVDEPHLITWTRIGIALALTQPEFAPSRGRGRPKGKSLPPGGGQVLAEAKKRMHVHAETFDVALTRAVKEANSKRLAGNDPEYLRKRVKRYWDSEREKALTELAQILAGSPRQKIGEPNS